MSVKLGSAGSDENRKLRGGQAGDQTGTEVQVIDWYLDSRGGWVVIRAKDDATREKIAYAMQRACDNDNIGYDQDQRYTAYDWCKYKNGGNYDPGAITAPVEVDCSALVRLCLAYAGIMVGDFYTGNEVNILNATGKFDIIKDTAKTNVPDYLLRGDILVTAKTGHTVVSLNNGDKAGAPAVDPTPAPSADGNKSQCGNGIGTAVANTTMYVRNAPNGSGSAVGFCNKGNAVEVLEITSNNWYKIVWPGCAEGYAYTSNANGRYYTYTANPETPKDNSFMVSVNTDLYVRKGPGTSYPVVKVARKGEEYKIVDTENNWGKLSDDSGWFSLKYTTRK